MRVDRARAGLVVLLGLLVLGAALAPVLGNPGGNPEKSYRLCGNYEGCHGAAGCNTSLASVVMSTPTTTVKVGDPDVWVTVDVTGANSTANARKAALSVANSPLVKTAIAGEDANWGRVVMAVGKSGAPLNQKKLCVSIGGVVIARSGGRVSGYDEREVASHLRGTEISIEVDLGVGRSRARVWTCDLTHDYISINADYRT